MDSFSIFLILLSFILGFLYIGFIFLALFNGCMYLLIKVIEKIKEVRRLF